MITIESPSPSSSGSYHPPVLLTAPSSAHVSECHDFCRSNDLTCTFSCERGSVGEWNAKVKINSCVFRTGGTPQYAEKKAAKKALAQAVVQRLQAASNSGLLHTLVGDADPEDINYVGILLGIAFNKD